MTLTRMVVLAKPHIYDTNSGFHATSGKSIGSGFDSDFASSGSRHVCGQ